MPNQPSKTITAVRKLELSQVTPGALQRELMGTDTSVDKFMLYFSSKMQFDVSNRIIDATIDRSIEASSAFTVIINDYDRAVLTSGNLNNRLDVQIDGLWFRLAGVDKSGDELTLTFEDREIAVLREYMKFKKVSRDKATRAEFVLNLIREVKEFDIPVQIPELHRIMPIERYNNDLIGEDEVLTKQPGMSPLYNISPSGNLFAAKTPEDQTPKNVYTVTQSKNANKPGYKAPTLTVKGAAAQPDQISNAHSIMAMGRTMANVGVNRKMIVCALMTAIQESTLHNINYGDNAHGGGTWDSLGLFQQTGSWGSVQDRMDPETTARQFYLAALKVDNWRNLPYWEVCYNTQHCAFDLRMAYGQWQSEAEDFVNSYGMTGGDNESAGSFVNGMYQDAKSLANKGLDALGLGMPNSSGGAYYFYRGTVVSKGSTPVLKPENSWSCIQRLADEVNFSAFFVSGVFYWISEDQLLKQRPQFELTEFMDGLGGIDGSYKHMSKAASLSVEASVGRWMAAPGTCVVVKDMGPWNGRWIVSEYSRSLFDLNATITLKKPRPMLPEPLQGNENDIKSWLGTSSQSQGQVQTNAGNLFDAGNVFSAPQDLATAAKALLSMAGKGRFTDSHNSVDLRASALGQKVSSQCGGQVYIDIKCIQMVLWLIQQGYKIGTYAWCSDHHCDGMSGHAGGHAVDIAVINDIAVNSEACGSLVIEVDTLLNQHAPDGLKPRQLISGGFGNHRDARCTGLCITDPVGLDPDSYYTPAVMGEHCNHIHVGY